MFMGWLCGICSLSSCSLLFRMGLHPLRWYWCIVFGAMCRAKSMTMMSRRAHTATPQCWIYLRCRLISEQLALYKHCRSKFKAGGVGCACVGSRVHCITVKPSLIYFCFVLFSLHDFLFVTNPSMSRLITDQGVMQTSYDMWCSQYYLKWLFCEVGWWGLLGQVHFFASICYFMHMQVIRKSGVDCGSGCYYCLSVTMFTWITYSD